IGDAFADRREDLAFLDHFARNVKRQIRAVDDKAHETQPAGQKIGVLTDQHATYIEFVAAFARRIEKIEGAGAGDEGKHRIFVAAFRSPMDGQSRLVELTGNTAIELGILVRLDLRLWLGP